MLKPRNLLVVTAMLLTFVAGSASAALQAGRDYDLISPAQPTDTNKIEVIEFFSYICPHCDHFDPTLNKWLKTLPKDVVFRRVPVIFRPQWEPAARLYYALKAMGQLSRLHSAVFDAIHVQHKNLMSNAGVIDWAVSEGLNREKFTAVYDSFTVQSETQGSRQKQSAYGIQAVPMLVVAGKYRTPEDFSGTYSDLLKLVDRLIDKVRTERGK